MGFQTVHQLLHILKHSISEIEGAYKAEGLDLPDLDRPYENSEAEKLLAKPGVIDASNRIVAAADHLIAAFKLPFLSLCDASMSYHLTSCLTYAEATHVIEILRDAGPAGLHVDKIAEKSKVDNLKLNHVLRLLATHHIFKEVKPNIFANNRISSYLDTGKTPDELISKPAEKYVGTSGAAAWIALAGDEMFKASAFMTDAYLAPKTAHSVLPTETAFTTAYKTEKPYFVWMEDPENTKHLTRFGPAMLGSSLWEAPDAILSGFDWHKLPAQSLIVDVGGGLGFSSLRIAQENKQVKIIIQDRAPVCATGEGMWKAQFPQAISEGRVKFEVHDFFTPQPIKDADVFLLRAICHDWPDDFTIKILTQLRNAAKPSTKLVLADHIMPYACPDDTDAANLPGAEKTLAPAPLLANLGKASSTAYDIDLTMQTMFNGQERSLADIAKLISKAGWKVHEVRLNGVSRFGHVIAVPA